MVRWYQKLQVAVMIKELYPSCGCGYCPDSIEFPSILAESGQRFAITEKAHSQCRKGDVVVLECGRLCRLFTAPQYCQWSVVE